MRTGTIFLAGPMTGLPEYNYPLFHDVADRLRDAGWRVVNPAESYGGDQTRPFAAYMHANLTDLTGGLVSQVICLPGWRSSPGATLEVAAAVSLGLTVGELTDTSLLSYRTLYASDAGRDGLAELLGISGQVERVIYPPEAPIIGIIGAKRAGKDSIANVLVAEHGYTRLAFADRLRDLALELNPLLFGRWSLRALVREYGWDEAKEKYPDVRRYLQTLGESVRNTLDEGAWVRPVVVQAASLTGSGIPVVVTDVRYPNEIEAIRAIGGKIVKVRRPQVRPDDPHPSESLAWDSSVGVDWLIDNDGTLDDLAELAGKLARAEAA